MVNNKIEASGMLPDAALAGKGILAMVNCPLCDAVIDVDEEELDEGDPLICEECGANMAVTGTSPLELTPEDADLDDEDDDLDDDDDDFDDDVDDDEEDDEDDEED